VCVLLYSGLLGALRDRANAFLEAVTDQALSRCLPMPFGDARNDRRVKDVGLGEWAIPLEVDALPSTVFQEAHRLLERIELDLIHMRPD
jgi:hypothetical protein